MTTALILYGTNTDSATMTAGGYTARGLVTSTGASGNGVPTTKIGTSTGWGNVPSDGTTSAWPAAGSAPDPVGTGWLFDSTLLEGQQIAAGTWTAAIQVAQSVQTSASTMDLYVRVFKLANDLVTYTHIGDMSLTTQSITTTLAQFNLTGSLAAVSFGTGDKLYLQDVANITANNTGSSTATLKWTSSNNATLGRANNMQITTPGYTAVVAPTIVWTDAGLNLLRDGAINADNPLVKYIAIGTGTTTPTTADTQLVAEVFRKAVTTYSAGAGTGEGLVTGYIGPNDAVGITPGEVGFFGGSTASITPNSGVLMARGLYSLPGNTAKTNSASIQGVLDFTIDQA